ncbi:uncharacterized protein V1510DRAFT_449821 [Dipodascopsis tothii]|uniref:uncharacterized protein n=1 Tax=Dipodascopsis tothii TaxID=44089 RepID=UPI0034CDF0B3
MLKTLPADAIPLGGHGCGAPRYVAVPFEGIAEGLTAVSGNPAERAAKGERRRESAPTIPRKRKLYHDARASEPWKRRALGAAGSGRAAAERANETVVMEDARGLGDSIEALALPESDSSFSVLSQINGGYELSLSRAAWDAAEADWPAPAFEIYEGDCSDCDGRSGYDRDVELSRSLPADRVLQPLADEPGDESDRSLTPSSLEPLAEDYALIAGYDYLFSTATVNRLAANLFAPAQLSSTDVIKRVIDEPDVLFDYEDPRSFDEHSADSERGADDFRSLLAPGVAADHDAYEFDEDELILGMRALMSDA